MFPLFLAAFLFAFRTGAHILQHGTLSFSRIDQETLKATSSVKTAIRFIRNFLF